MGQIKRGREFLRYLWMPATRGPGQWSALATPWADNRPNLRARSNRHQVVDVGHSPFPTLEDLNSWRLALPGPLTTPVHKSCQENRSLDPAFPLSRPPTLERDCQRAQERIASQVPLQRRGGLKKILAKVVTPTVGRLTSAEKLPGLASQMGTQRNVQLWRWRINVTATRTPSAASVSVVVAGIQILLLRPGSLQGLAVV